MVLKPKPRQPYEGVPFVHTPGGFDVSRARRRVPFVVVLGFHGHPVLEVVRDAFAVNLLETGTEFQAESAAALLYVMHGRDLRWPTCSAAGAPTRARRLLRLARPDEVTQTTLEEVRDLGCTSSTVLASEGPLWGGAGNWDRQRARLLALVKRYVPSPEDDLAHLHDLAVFGIPRTEYGAVEPISRNAEEQWAIGLFRRLLARGESLGSVTRAARAALEDRIRQAGDQNDQARLAALRHLVAVGRETFYANVAQLEQDALHDAAVWVRASPNAAGAPEIGEALRSGGRLHDLFYTRRPALGGQPFVFYALPPAQFRMRLPAVVDYACDHLDSEWHQHLVTAFEQQGAAVGERLISNELAALCAAIGAGRATARAGIQSPRDTRGRRCREERYASEGADFPLSAGLAPPDEQLERNDAEERLAQLRQRVEQLLTKKQRAVFWPCLVEHVKQRNVAMQLGVGESAVTNLIQNAWRRLERKDRRLYLQLRSAL